MAENPRKPLAFPAPLAPYACLAAETLGRLRPEPESATRTPFARDRDRVIHAVAFRRLKHKTQVFVATEGDHYRTRLTHSIEVAQIARSLARRLRLDEDLAETVALSHDLGHPPFGHAGEEALDACMAAYDGFDHNAQTLRILTRLERKYPAFDGLNLTWETLEGAVKHNGPLIGPNARKDEPLPAAIVEYAEKQDLRLDTFPSLEAQAAAIADDIAYNNHDVEDGFRAGLFSLDDLRAAPLVDEIIAGVRAEYTAVQDAILMAETVRRMIGMMVDDVAAETERRLADADPRSADDVRAASHAFVAFSPPMDARQKELRAFLAENMYRHPRVARAMSQAKRLIVDLFELFIAQPEVLKPEWRARCDAPMGAKTARAACDYIAGMTDSYAAATHRRLFKLQPWI